LSVEENAVPKRRSSAANRRRSRKPGTHQTGAVTSQPVETTSVATADATQSTSKPSRTLRRRAAEAPVEAVDTAATTDEAQDRNVRRREERRRAKQQQPERSGVGRVVNTERFSGARKFYNDTASEIRKVIWPDRETTRNLTIVVIALSAIMGFLLGGIDWVLFQLFEAIG
jgi:preprotein translocase subunit SecE